MLKKITKFSTFAFALMLICTSAFGKGGWTNNKGEAELVYWQRAYYKICDGDLPTSYKMCIGNSMKNGFCNSNGIESAEGGDDWGYNLMVAREASTEGRGIKFCPTTLIGEHSKKGRAQVWYFNATGDCVWLCRNGYSGEQCEKTIDKTDKSQACDNTLLLQKNYDSTAQISSAGVGSEILNYRGGGDGLFKCGSGTMNNHNEEHDIIFVISDWLPSGHGAKVRAFIARGSKNDNSGDYGYIRLYPARTSDNGSTDVSEILACKIGFKPNANGNDCEPINYDACGIDKWCEGWNEKNYDESKHTKVNDGDCVKWRCKDENSGLTSVGGAECKKCDSGKAVSAKTGKCATAIVISKDRMLYGKYGNATSPLDQQCWTKTDPTEYYDCVMNENQPETSEPADTADTADNADTQE